MKKILIIFIVLITGVTSFSQNIKPDTRLYECFDNTHIEYLQKNYPDSILFYNYFLDNSYSIIDYPKEKPITGENISNVTMKKKSPSGEIQYFNEDLTNFDTKKFNPLKYNFKFYDGKYSQYVFQNKKVLILYPYQRIIKDFAKHKESLK